MSAAATTMCDFIEALRLRVPAEIIHPSAKASIHWQLAEMRDEVDDPARVVKLAAQVRERIVDELRWEAVKWESVGDFKTAYRLRRRADRFEATHA